jgi:hypothetical protein
MIKREATTLRTILEASYHQQNIYVTDPRGASPSSGRIKITALAKTHGVGL